MPKQHLGRRQLKTHMSRHFTEISSDPRTSMLPLALAAGVTLFFIGGTGANSLLALFALIVLSIAALLLWRPRESPILLFVFAMQWLQASISIFYANWIGVDVSQVNPHGGDQERAIALSLTGLLMLTIGMRLGTGPRRMEDGIIALRVATSHTCRKWFQLYALACAGAFLGHSFAYAIPGLQQPLLAIASIKWAFYWMLSYATFVRTNDSRIYFLAAFAFELASGLGGYFSDFKTVLFFTLFAFAASGLQPSLRSVLGSAMLGAVILAFGLVWTAIKGEYRQFASGGEAAQIVTVDYATRLHKLAELVTDLDGDDLVEATGRLIGRITYVEFFAVVLDTVPRVVPHEDGALWLDAVLRPFMPRLLFPGKPAIDDSERTRLYTGLGVSGAERGTSISIGYMGESYIDFGEYGMMFPVFLLGLLYGRIWRWLTSAHASQGVVGMAIASAVLYGGSFMETSITKVFGGLMVSLLVSWFFIRYIAPRYFPWITMVAVQK